MSLDSDTSNKKAIKMTESTSITSNETTDDFPIIGIGASAGGLEALEEFFQHFPDNSGMAFVLVSHLAPNQDSALAEILQRTTTMKVVEAVEQTTVAANCVYVIPPNKSLTIFHRVLQLNVPEQSQGQRLLIDVFLRSLAEDQGEAAVGIILSGTGTDGTQGLRAILGAGGMSLVQEPGTARFDGMPLSAIQSGYASHVLTIEKMPAFLIHQYHIPVSHQESPLSFTTVNGINRILMQLRNSTGQDFSLYKKTTIQRRIQRRMAVHNIDNMEVYARYLKDSPVEVSALFKELLINVTNFFRDPEAFEILQQTVFPDLFANKPKDYTVRVWIAGCASGEEAYSIAILLSEFIDAEQNDFKIQIYATDLDEDAIITARDGFYPANIIQDVSPERLHRYFNKDAGGYRIKKNIREVVVFAVQNLIKDPPFTKLDLLCCRNVMIYLEPELQNRLLPTFHYALRTGGILFLSPSESVGNHFELFTPVNRKWKLYQATFCSSSSRTLMGNTLRWTHDPNIKMPESVLKTIETVNFAELCKRALLQFYAPASVVTDLTGNLFYVHGETGKYLRPAPGQVSLNIIDMAREGLVQELRAAINNTVTQGLPISSNVLSVKTNGNFHPMTFCIRLLVKQIKTGEDFLLVSFHDVVDTAQMSPDPLAPAELQQVEELKRELSYTRENLQRSLEDHNATNEEYKCTHEEMQSTNEELQSTNEEIETSKEELQSINEELLTVNSELQAKIVQLSNMQNDMKNLFDNIRIGILFLDRKLRVRRFTRQITEIYRLVDSDIGRQLSDIKSDLLCDSLLDDAQAVLNNLVPCEREVSTNKDTRFQVCIKPYRTMDNIIDGVVLTFNDLK